MKAILFCGVMLLFSAAWCQQPATKSGAYEYRSPGAGGTGKWYMGREIAHIMGASGASWLERSSRSREENTDLMVKHMNIKPGQVLADIGAGTGYYTFRVAKLSAPGKVYAVEIQDELIKTLNNKKRGDNVTNVEVVKGDSVSVNLPGSSVDVVFMVDVYHELLWPKEILQSIRKSLKPGGKLILIEYKGEDPEIRIKPLHKMTIAQLTRELNANGFVLEKHVDEMPIQHLTVWGCEK